MLLEFVTTLLSSSLALCMIKTISGSRHRNFPANQNAGKCVIAEKLIASLKYEIEIENRTRVIDWLNNVDEACNYGSHGALMALMRGITRH